MKQLSVFKFEGFMFDSASYRLTYNGENVGLRPKALQLLRLLIVNRERVVSKSELLSSLWGSAYARDHLLFQLISELRKTPFDAGFVRTQPNEGYQWSVKTKIVSFNIPRPLQISASLMAGLVCLLALSFAWFERASLVSSVQLPAYSAFSKGVIALQKGEREQAVEWLKFALNENPESAEISLFLAETLYEQDKPDEASGHLQALLLKPHLGAYDHMTATNLLSRIRQRQGRFSDALRYAKMSSQTDVIAQCSIDVVEQRIELLEGKFAKPIASSDLDPKPKGASDIKQSSVLDNYSDQCNQLKQAVEETSYCQLNQFEYLYADTRELTYLKFS